MPQILQVIPPQNFELVNVRIAEIIADEVAHQAGMTYDTDLEKLTVYIERGDPINHTESPCINVSLAKGDYVRKHQGCADAEYIYNIDFYGNRKDSKTQRGDESAGLLVQKFIGLIRAILENPVYNTLGYQKGFIGGTMVQSIQVANLEPKDGLSNYMSRMSFFVRMTEVTSFKECNLIQGYETTVKINTSNQGYKWIGENYS